MSSSYHITDAALEGHYRDMFKDSYGYDPLDPNPGDGWTEDDLDVLDWEDEEEEER